MNEEMIREIGFYQDIRIKFIIKDAKDDITAQKRDILELCNQNIAVLIVSPIEAESLTKVISDVYNRGIPVILVDRKVCQFLHCFCWWKQLSDWHGGW